MTEFGRVQLELILRIRTVLVVLALAFTLFLHPQATIDASFILVLLLALDLGMAIASNWLIKRFGAARCWRLFLALDLGIIALGVFGSGGVESGLTALYAVPPFAALLMLGRDDALRYGVAAVCFYVAQIGLHLIGISTDPADQIQFNSPVGESASLFVFLIVMFVVAYLSVGATRQRHSDKDELEAERALAESAHRQWTLVNTVALRIQEAATPQQVYTTIGDEMERLGLHIVILEWAEPGVSMQVSYVSAAAEAVERALGLLKINFETFHLALTDDKFALARAVTMRTPILIEDPTAFVAPLLPHLQPSMLSQLFARFGVSRMIFAPMQDSKQVCGVLMVYGRTLAKKDLLPLAALANQAALAVEKACLLSEQRKRAAQLEMVSALAARMSATGTQGIQPIIQQVCQEFGYHTVAVFEIDAAQNHGVLRAVSGFLAEHNDPSYIQELTRGIVGVVARSGETYLARDTRLDPNYFSPFAPPDPVRSELTIPLKQAGFVFGILDVHSTQPDAFDAGDVTALEILAELIGAEYIKANALATEQKRAAHLAWVSEVASRAGVHPEPDAIVKTLIELIQARFGYHRVSFALYDAARQELELQAVAGNSAAMVRTGQRWSAERGLLGLAARTGRTVVTDDVHNDPRYIAGQDNGAGTNSELCIPFISGNRVVGVLGVESRKRNAFDVNDVGAMEALANQMSGVLERANLLQIEQHRAAQMALVNRIASRTARLVPTAQLLREAVDLVQTQFRYYNVAIFGIDDTRSSIPLIANAGGLESLLGATTPTMERGIIKMVGTSGSAYLCVNTLEDPHYFSPFPPESPDPVRSEIAIPLRRGSSVIGVLDIQSERVNAFAPSDITALQVLADQLAAAMENARLYEAAAQRAAQLDAVRVLALQVTAERDLDALLQAIVSNAMALVHADGATLDLLDEAQGELVVHISRNLPQDYVGYRLRLGEGLAGYVAFHGEPMVIGDYATWEGHAPAYARAEFAGMMAVPLKWQARVLGVISLHRQRGRAQFNPEELRLADLFAAQAAIALENARLFDALAARLRAQQALTEISGTLLEMTAPQAILDHVAHAAVQVLDSELALVFLVQEQAELSVASCAGRSADTLSGADLPTDFREVVGTAFTTKQPALWQPEEVTHSEPGALSTLAPALHSGIAVPMQVGENVVGVVAAARQAGRRYDATDMQTLALLANQTASALERAKAYRQEQQRVHELNLLYESYRATASTLEPTEVIQRLLEQLVQALDVTSAYFVRIDLAERELIQTQEHYAAHAHALERTIDNRVWKFDSLPEIQELLEKKVHIAQLADSTLLPEARTYMETNQVQTILRVLLIAGEQISGYLSLWETRAPRKWDPNETRFVQAMASQAAAALVNAQLFQAAQTRSRELQALYEAGRLLNSSFDIAAICQNSADSLRDILGYYHVSIYFIQDNVLRCQVQRGYAIMLDNIPLTHGIMARAVTTRQTIYLPDVSQEPEFLRAAPDVQSEIAVPLLVGERVLGVLNVETVHAEPGNERPSYLTTEDVQLLNTYANQLVIAIENARLFQETQQHLKQVSILHAASQVVNSELELDVVLERVAGQFVHALVVDSCTLTEWDRASNELVILVDHDTPVSEKPGVRFPVNDTFVAKVLQHESVVALHADDPTNNLETQTYLQDYAWQSVLLVPLVGKGQVIGLVELGDRKGKRTFSDDELRLASSLAAQAAIAIENAKLYRAAQQRLAETETLYRFARELGGMLDIQTLGSRALESAARFTDFDIGEVSLVREADGALVPLVMVGNAELNTTHPIAPRGVGIVGWVVEHGRTVRVGDVTQDPRYHEISPYIMSELCLPLRVGDRVIGVLNLEAKAPDAFDARVEQLLMVFANQLAIAIENARLYEQTKRDAEVKAALLRELSHRVKNNLAAITSLLYMALDEQHETREQILSETLGRVQSMSTAHALLARTPLAYVDLLDLGAQVLSDTVRNLAKPGAQIQIETSGAHVQLAMRQTTTLALVLNELATNALRHGLDETAQEPLVLRFTVMRELSQVEFLLQDNGKRLPEGFELGASAGLGLTLVRTLVEKDLHGKFSLIQNDQWATATVHFGLEEELR
ncbi:MAG: GAF domain-containing protein [Chloroflexi bacterium]|nr:GAF domain-containing protein [Chloroflexota bacterium]